MLSEPLVKRVKIPWTSSAGGSATVVTDKLNGILLAVEPVPGTGTSQPTNLYDVTLTDEAGVDVLAGQGANLSNAAPSVFCPGVPITDGTSTSTLPRPISDVLTLNVSNAGNAKSGSVWLYLR
jgi:hypothetical protein